MENWHPTNEALFEFHIHQLQGPMSHKVQDHLVQCEQCTAILADYTKLAQLMHDQVKELPSQESLDAVMRMARQAVRPHGWNLHFLKNYFLKPALGLSFVFLITFSVQHFSGSKLEPQTELAGVSMQGKEASEDVVAGYASDDMEQEGRAKEPRDKSSSPAPAVASQPNLAKKMIEEKQDDQKVASLQPEENIAQNKDQAQPAPSIMPNTLVASQASSSGAIAVDEKEPTPEFLYERARYFEKNGKYDRAEKVYARLLRENPSHAHSAEWKKRRGVCLAKLQPAKADSQEASKETESATTRKNLPSKGLH